MEEAHKDPVRSPFSGVQSTIVRPERLKPRIFAITLTVLLGVLVVAGGFVLFQKGLSDPLRTLQDFPVDEYYENHSALEGTRFKARLKAVNQIGWKEDLGRLVIFEAGAGGKPVVVVIPPNLETLSIESGQPYQAEIRVTEGGLLKANYLRKD